MASPMYPSRIEHHLTERTVINLIEMLEKKQLSIPEHQRNYCWTSKKECRLVQTVKIGLPMPAIIIREHDRLGTEKTLEDGHQRLTCLKKYRTNEFAVDGKKYSELNERERFLFDEYRIPVISYSGATDEQAIRNFDNFQNGTALSVGERLHSLTGLSEVVTFAKQLLLTKGDYNTRGIPIWGAHLGIGSRGNDLTNAVALTIALAFSQPNKIVLTKKYEELRDYIDCPLNATMKAKVKMYLERLFDIYEAVEARSEHLNQADINFQWNHGNFTGYIVYSLISHPAHQKLVVERWIDYITEIRKERRKHKTSIKSILEDTLHSTKTGARSWKNDRWRAGCALVFKGTELEPFYTTPAPPSKDESPDDDDDDYDEDDSAYASE